MAKNTLNDYIALGLTATFGESKRVFDMVIAGSSNENKGIANDYLTDMMSTHGDMKFYAEQGIPIKDFTIESAASKIRESKSKLEELK